MNLPIDLLSALPLWLINKYLLYIKVIKLIKFRVIFRYIQYYLKHIFRNLLFPGVESR